MRTTDVAVLAGGHESEHAISLLTSATLAEAATLAGYTVHPVVISESGTWNLSGPWTGKQSWPVRVPKRWEGALVSGEAVDVLRVLRDRTRVVLIGLHGRGGEDGSIQGLLECCGFGYSGCGVQASAFAIDKVQFKRLLLASGIPTPDFREVLLGDGMEVALEQAVQALGPPLVVKAPGLGSSVSVHPAHDVASARAHARRVLMVEGRVLLERMIPGREFTCAVFGSGDHVQALPVIEICPKKAGWFDYASKYEAGGADEIVPARIDPTTTQLIQHTARKAHQLIGARGVTRTDVILDQNGVPQILELNTLPGMTAASLVPKAAAAAGIPLPALVSLLIHDAIRSGMPRPGSRAADRTGLAGASG